MRRLDDHEASWRDAREERVEIELTRAGRSIASLRHRRSRVVVAVGVDVELLAPGQPNRDQSGNAGIRLVTAGDQNAERCAARPARQHHRRISRQPQPRPGGIDDPLVGGRDVRHTQRPGTPVFDAHERLRAETGRRPAAARDRAEHPHRGPEPAAVAAAIEHQRRRRLRRSRRQREVQRQRLPVEIDVSGKLADRLGLGRAGRQRRSAAAGQGGAEHGDQESDRSGRHHRQRIPPIRVIRRPRR